MIKGNHNNKRKCRAINDFNDFVEKGDQPLPRMSPFKFGQCKLLNPETIGTPTTKMES